MFTYWSKNVLLLKPKWASFGCVNSIFFGDGNFVMVRTKLRDETFCCSAKTDVSMRWSPLWIHSCSSGRAQHIFVLLEWLMRWEVTGLTNAILCSEAFYWICSKQHGATWCCHHQDLSSGVSLKSQILYIYIYIYIYILWIRIEWNIR